MSCDYCAGLGVRDYTSHQTEVCPFRAPLREALEAPPDTALLAAKARLVKEKLRLSREQEWRQMLEAEARWLGPFRHPIQTFAPGVGWTRSLDVPLGRRARYRRALTHAAMRVGLYALAALLSIGAAWLVS